MVGWVDCPRKGQDKSRCLSQTRRINRNRRRRRCMRRVRETLAFHSFNEMQ